MIASFFVLSRMYYVDIKATIIYRVLILNGVYIEAVWNAR